MKRLTYLLALIELATMPIASVAVPAAAKQWNVNNASQVSFAVEYEHYNKSTQLGYEDRTFGADLGWISNAGYFEFRRQAPAERPN
jgi:hypothetical protein